MNIESTNEFDPASIRRTGNQKVVWIIDECDELMFQDPHAFAAKLSQMQDGDIIICLTATPCKQQVNAREYRFIESHC